MGIIYCPIFLTMPLLQFSFVGMKSQDIAVGNKTGINVTLAEETVGIEEVVAIGYGTQKEGEPDGSHIQYRLKRISKRHRHQLGPKTFEGKL